MKTIKIYKRTILERTGFKKHPFKEVDQITFTYDGKTFSNHFEDINNPRLKVKFELVLETRKISVLENYRDLLGRTESDKWLKQNLTNLIKYWL